MNLRFYILILTTVLFFTATSSSAETLNIKVEIPTLEVTPYHKPYVAVWIETTNRKGVHTLAFWKEQSDWFKDLRQWWRKIGRNKSPNYDAVTGATRKPGSYQLTWNGELLSGEKLSSGDYVLHVEAVREQGSREYLRQNITLGKNNIQNYTLQGNTELGEISIYIY